MLDALHQDTPKTCRAHFVSLSAGAFGVAKGCHPLAPSRRALHQSANTKHQNLKMIAVCGEGGEKLGPLAPLSRHRGGLSDRVHLEGRSKIPKQAAGCKNRLKSDRAEKAPKTRAKALQTFRR